MKRAIITGATSMIGVALVNKLLEENVEMLLFVRKSSRVDRIPKSDLISIEYCDMDDYRSINKIDDKKYDVFYHFAWMGTTGVDRNDMYMQSNNIRYSLDAVNLANKFGCKVFIGAGSQAEYGNVDCDMDSDTPTNPSSGYGIAKLCAGQMTRNLCNKLNIKHIWTRILSVYGPYDNENSLIMYTIKSISSGDILRLTKCDQIWDYIYSKDVANIFYLLYEKGKNNKNYVIGNGAKESLRSYVEKIRNIINPDYQIEYGKIPYYDNQCMYLSANIDSLVNDLNYKMTYTFEKGISELYEWYTKQV